MKQKEVNKLDREDEKAAGLFVKLGMPKNLAKTLLSISQVDQCCSSDIEQGADLRQPEVSIAMQELLKRKWVKKRSQKTKGKGRPVHIYTPAKDLTTIWKTLQSEKRQEMQTVQENFSELKTLLSP